MAEVTVRAFPQSGRLVVTVTDTVDLDPALVVERDDGDGFKVRRMARVLDQARTKVWADYEVPTDRRVVYRAAGATAVGVLPSNGLTWWKPLPFPALSMPVEVGDFFRDGTSESETVDVFPRGARSPITVSGARRMMRGTVTVTTFTAVEGQRFADGLQRSPVVLVQPPGGRAQVYMTVKQVQAQRARMLTAEHVVWVLECQQREAPTVVWSYPAAATWGTYVEAGKTWNDWRRGTWLDVLLGV